MSWGIADTAPEIEKIKAESADYLHGLDSCGIIDWDTYNYAFDFYMDLLNRAYEQGRKDASSDWTPCSERLPEEDHWLGGSGKQFSDEVLVSVVNYDDEDIWAYISQTIDGEWALELPSHCKIIAWMPLPEPYRGGDSE